MRKIISRFFLLFIIATALPSCEAMGLLRALNETSEERREREAREDADYVITDPKTGEKKYVKDLKKDK